MVATMDDTALETSSTDDGLEELTAHNIENDGRLVSRAVTSVFDPQQAGNPDYRLPWLTAEMASRPHVTVSGQKLYRVVDLIAAAVPTSRDNAVTHVWPVFKKSMTRSQFVEDRAKARLQEKWGSIHTVLPNNMNGNHAPGNFLCKRDVPPAY